MTTLDSQEGKMQWGNKYETWYKIVGDLKTSTKPPLLCCHGGPGMPSQYLRTFGEVASRDRAVIFYDQLGCGNSTGSKQARGDTPALDFWTPRLFVEELTELVAHLKLESYHLLGQSWGTCLALEYAFTKPAGLRTLILCDGMPEGKQWIESCNYWRAQLPQDVQDTLLKHEQAGTMDHPDYEAATDVFNKKHLCRMDPFPQDFLDTVESHKRDPEVYLTMNGPNEFHVIGPLKDFTTMDRLDQITWPTKLIYGKYDEGILCQEAMKKAIKGCEASELPNSSHLPHLEEKEATLKILSEWLESHD